MASALVRVVTKIPPGLRGAFQKAVKGGEIVIAADGVVHVYKEYLHGPLKEFFEKNVPDVADKVASVAKEAYNEAEYFVVHQVGEPVARGFKDLGDKISREAENFANTVTRGAEAVADAAKSAWNRIGGLFGI